MYVQVYEICFSNNDTTAKDKKPEAMFTWKSGILCAGKIKASSHCSSLPARENFLFFYVELT